MAPTAYAEAAKKDAERACVGTDPSVVFKCVSEKAETAYQTAHDEQDLSAQQRAASSALVTAILSFLALALSGVGVWFVKRTLDATLEAVEDTGKATQAMERQNELAQHAQRPWLKIEVRITKAENTGTGIVLRYEAKVTNIGKMVAERCAVRGGFVSNDHETSGLKKIQKYRADAEAVSGNTEEGPRMPYPIIPGETKTIAGETQVNGDLPFYQVNVNERRTPYIVFICARYFVPGETEMRVIDRAFSVDYTKDIDDPFTPYGIPIPLPDDLSKENVLLRPGGHNRTT
ncbi:MAG: hypothetical protein KA233_07550 [Novosphingobium sp.]|nr:hypothetical protein [Novosphingobium sp.]MBP6555521.1 hypothetical protein [Novosphingobium sp.]